MRLAVNIRYFRALSDKMKSGTLNGCHLAVQFSREGGVDPSLLSPHLSCRIL